MCRPLATFICADCQKQLTDSAYAIKCSDNAKICDDCAHKSELKSIAENDCWTIYGPQSLRRGQAITNWPGNVLGRISHVGYKPHPFTIRSHWGKKYHCHIIMVDGSKWQGWIGEGVASNIRLVSR